MVPSRLLYALDATLFFLDYGRVGRRKNMSALNKTSAGMKVFAGHRAITGAQGIWGFLAGLTLGFAYPCVPALKCYSLAAKQTRLLKKTSRRACLACHACMWTHGLCMLRPCALVHALDLVPSHTRGL